MKKSIFIFALSGVMACIHPAPSLAQTHVSTAQVVAANSKTYAARFEKFVDEVAACDTLSRAQKDKVTATYRNYLAEYKVVKDSLSDEDVRICSKAKVKYQKAQARIFVVNTSNDVSDTAEGVGKSVSKFFKRTKKKVQGAIDGFKDN